MVVADRSVLEKGMCECVQALTAMSVQANSLLTEVSAAIYQRGKKQVKKLLKSKIGTTIKDEAIAF